MSFRSWAVGAAAAIVVANSLSPVRADEHPNVARGYSPYAPSFASGIDQISTWNGSLTVSIPLRTFQVNALSYSFNLVNSSQPWDTKVWSNSTHWVQKFPNRLSSAGLGWHVTLGQLVPKGLYGTDGYAKPDPERTFFLAPDGSRTVFHDRLHHDDVEDPGDSASVQNVTYSRSGNHLRLQKLADQSYKLESGDGTVRFFDALGELTRIEDKFGNFVQVTDDDLAATTTYWDGIRATTIHWQDFVVDGFSYRTVSSIDFPAFAGTTATYTFQYFPVDITPECTDTYQGNPSTFEDVPLLTLLQQPDSATYVMPNYLVVPEPQSCARGVLKRLELPTGGALEWDWANYSFPSDVEKFQTFTSIGGVVERRTLVPGGTGETIEGRWVYAEDWEDWSSPISGGASTYATAKRTVVSPLGDKSEYFYSAWPYFDGPTAGWGNTIFDYGLPIKRSSALTSPAAFLSSRTWDCEPNPDPNQYASPINCGAEPLQETFVRYEQDLDGGSYTQTSVSNTNRREVYRRTLDDESPGSAGGIRFADVTRSGFDGLGHYRQVDTNGDYPVGNVKRTFTQFHPGQAYPNPVGQPKTFTPLAPSAPWILGTFIYTEITEEQDGVSGTSADEVARKELVIESSTGFLSCVRSLKAGTARSKADLLTKYFRDAAGNVTAEQSFGGDRQSASPSPGLGTAGTCSDNGSLPVEYSVSHTYQNGTRRRSQVGGMSWYGLDLDIDASTGLPVTSRDPALVPTTFLYDNMSRTTWVKPGGTGSISYGKDAWTRVTYDLTYPTGATVDLCTPDTTCSQSAQKLASSEVELDALGRVPAEARRLDASSWSRRGALYDAMGHLRRVTSWVFETANPNDETLPATVYSGYDPFGRATSIVGADGKETKLEYTGALQVGTKQSIAIGASGEAEVARYELFDRQGRLYRLEEWSKPNQSDDAVTHYSYDEENRLRRVCADRNDSTGNCGQERLFTFDNRGFLLSETHPEKGWPIANAAVTYSNFDSHGNAWRRRDGVDTTARQLDFTFDAAERLLTVKDSSGNTWKQFTYDSGAGAGAIVGKLSTAMRRNASAPPINALVLVTETYEYNGRMGRPSKRKTQINTGGANQELWQVGLSYDALGDPIHLDYPTCTGGSCAGSTATPARAIDFTRSNGLLTAVPGWASSLGYHPNRMLASVAHANGTVDAIANDPFALQRPASITVTPGDEEELPWSTGAYAFDGAGNVKSMGSDSFRYDKVSRLVSATLGSLSPSRSQSYTFDTYGNISSKLTDGNTVAIPIETVSSKVTNRLAPAGQGGTASYDVAGNLLAWSGQGYSWDLLNMMTGFCTTGSVASCGGERWSHYYTADDERILSAKSDNSASFWTLRGLGNELLTRDERYPNAGSSTTPPWHGGSTCSGTIAVFCDNFELGDSGAWTTVTGQRARVVADYIFRDGQILGSRDVETGQPTHFSLDHLGTVRVVTNDIGAVEAIHTYFPFGEEASSSAQDAEPMKFTGHERDLQTTTTAPADDLDMMHARFHSPLTFRFLSFDPVGGNPRAPQSWNRFSYVLGNPLKFVDPTGLVIDCSSIGASTENGISGRCNEAITVSAKADPLSIQLDTGGDIFIARVTFDSLEFGRHSKSYSGFRDSGFKLGQLIPRAHAGNEDAQLLLGWDRSFIGAIEPVGGPFEFGLALATGSPARFLGRGSARAAASAAAFDADQQALVALAKEVQRTGVTMEQAGILKQWAAEYRLRFRGPEAHPGRPFGQYPHIHVGPINHIPVNP